MINVLDTILFLNPSWKGAVWENNVDHIQPNEEEDNTPSVSSILAANQDDVVAFKTAQEGSIKDLTLVALQQKLLELSQQINSLLGT